MVPFAGEFQFPRLERVVSGVGTLSTLATELDQRRLTRAVIVTGRRSARRHCSTA
jgi:hypothetical protein